MRVPGLSPPLSEKPARPATVGKARRVPGPRERSLTELLSLTDAWKFVPESVGLIALIWLARILLMDGPGGLSDMSHLFWIPVLLMSCQYGIMGGLFATLAATTAFFIDGLPPRYLAQDFYDYAGIVAAQPCAWFGTALVLGGLRTLHMHHQSELQDRFDQTVAMAEEMANGLERTIREIESLEHRIATDHGTLAALLHSLSKLKVGDRRSLVASFSDVIHLVVGATTFAVYLNGQRGLEPCVGIVDGVSVAPAAIPPLPADPRPAWDSPIEGGSPTTDGDGITCMPLWASIRQADFEPAGVVVCTRLHPSQAPAIASRRLNEVCRVLAVLLTACPALASEAA
jgi:hypothetical protein